MENKPTVGPMDPELRIAIERFGYKWGICYPRDFAKNLSEYLQDRGYSIDCVVQYNEGKFIKTKK